MDRLQRPAKARLLIMCWNDERDHELPKIGQGTKNSGTPAAPPDSSGHVPPEKARPGRLRHRCDGRPYLLTASAWAHLQGRTVEES